MLKVRDRCSNVEIQEIPFRVVDCKAPTPYCIAGLSVDLMPTGEVTLWASDFDAGSFDNCTAPDQLKLSFADPDLYPDSISRVFKCRDGEIGVVPVELWAQDLAGNKAFCSTFVNVQNNSGNANCASNGNAVLAGVIETETGAAVEETEVTLSGDLQASTFTGINGIFNFPVPADLDSPDFSITPHKDNDPLNGVSTLDLVLMSKHILGVELLDSPYKIIAADVNHSGSITTFDIVQLRKLILNITETFESNTSWRFIPADFVFPDPRNPFLTAFPEIININDFDSNSNLDFIGVKVGDLNGSAIANASNVTTRSYSRDFAFEVEEITLEKGETYAIDLNATLASVEGYQFTLTYDTKALSLKNIVFGTAGSEHIAVLQDGVITVSWNGATERSKAFSLVVEAKQKQPLSQSLAIVSTHTPAEAYDRVGNIRNVVLDFSTQDTDKGFELQQNQPNPFKNETNIGFVLPSEMEATISVHDLTGQLIFQYASVFKAGKNEVKLNQAQLPAGVLYYTLATDSFTATKRMIVLSKIKFGGLLLSLGRQAPQKRGLTK
ncbi:MAG: T9SS type A sorting domain-containing protein [Saprospiraceae bacterium]|nr:T9SS type A sorting domain-containing protein [Saprospiraceae bacterium]